MLKSIVLGLSLTLGTFVLQAQPDEPTAQQRRAALRAAVQSRSSNGAVRPEPGPAVARQLSPQEREELRRQLRQQRREALRQAP